MERKYNTEKGSALLIVTIMVAVVMLGLTGLFALSKTSDTASYEGNNRLVRLYAAESGLNRAVKNVMNTEDEGTGESVGSAWLTDNADDGPVVWGTGLSYYNLGGCTVQVEVESLGDGWYMVKSSATDKYNDTTSVARTVRGESYWSDYARFVSAGVLNIGSYAYYGGKVHCNSNINVVGKYVKFEDDVTAAGKISTYTNKKYPEQNTVFMKNATSGVPEIELPDADAIKAKFNNAPAGALVYSADNSDFKTKANSLSGYTPLDSDKVYTDITFKNDVMDITTTIKNSKNKLKASFTEANVAIQDDVAIYVSDDVVVEGNISRRTSILTSNDISIDGPIRYVDDDGGAMWQLVDKDTGVPEPFDDSKNSWSTMGNWTGSGYEYKVADDWETRTVNNDREKPPCLGLMSGSTIYITGESDNRELHAALFTSGDVVRPAVSGKKKNLYINGAIITTGTNPVSSYFSYRCYAYDPYLKKFPPPEFNQTDKAAFTNWHIIEE